MPSEQHGVPRPFGGHSYIAESDQPEERQLIAAVLTVTDARIRLLEDFERSLWAERHPGVELDCDLLLKEVQQTVQRSDGVTLADWYILQKLDVLHHLRRERTMHLGCLAASLRPCPRPPVVFPSVSQDASALLADPGLHITNNQSSLEHSIRGSQFWAVIIGINVYDDPSIPRLRGCVPDALAMYTYLTHDLHVPPDHICVLTQSEGDHPPVWAWPTRQNILSALYTHLRDNPRIRTGDHMLIYFSGHGSAYYASDAFSSPAARVGSIEALCPSDRGTAFGLDPGDIVCDISDREMNVFLSELRAAKGPRTTLVLDCCHSGGMARSAPVPRPTARFADPLPLAGMLRAADADLRRWPASRRAADETWAWDTAACVLLAACRDYEQAYERPAGGVFTRALLGTLRRAGGGSATYAALGRAVGAEVARAGGAQHPVVVGDRRGCRVWF